MKAEDIERMYREVALGYDEPKVVYCYGGTLLELLKKIGDLRTLTNDGKPIVAEGYYELSSAGIVHIE